MRAFIKENKWDEFKELCSKYGFSVSLRKPKQYFQKEVDVDIMLLVNKKTRELHLITPMGESPFMEVHIDTYKDIYDLGYIEYIEGRFD